MGRLLSPGLELGLYGEGRWLGLVLVWLSGMRDLVAEEVRTEVRCVFSLVCGFFPVSVASCASFFGAMCIGKGMVSLFFQYVIFLFSLHGL